MCVVAFAWLAHPRWRLVLAGNRDEFHARPALPLDRWPGASHVLGGIDLKSGGTWLGVSEEGRLAVITNLRGFGLPVDDAPSRGALVADFLAGGAYSAPSLNDLAAFNPFNLITVAGNDALFSTSRPLPAQHSLPPGVHGVSNGPIDAPWFKTKRLERHLAAWLEAGDRAPAALLDALQDEHVPTMPEPGIGPSDVPEEPPVSPIFIRDMVYGTRCGTVVAIDALGQGMIIERRFAPNGDPVGETALAFRWPA